MLSLSEGAGGRRGAETRLLRLLSLRTGVCHNALFPVRVRRFGRAMELRSAFRSFESLVGEVSASDPVRVTYRNERRRAIAAGIIETATTTFLLLIAVRVFHAGPLPKALLASCNSFGFLATPLVVTLVARSRLPVARAAARFLALGAVGFLIASLVPVLAVFVATSAFAISMAGAVVPLQTKLYQDNYPALVRGRLYARTSMIRIFAGGTFAALAGWCLSGRIELYPLLLLIFAAAFACASVWVGRCPSHPIAGTESQNLFAGFRHLGTDRLFRNTIICWMIMGFGNLMMLPLRVEYLANPRHGLALSEVTVAMLVMVIPNVVRLICSPIWGALFDRVNFFWLRVLANLGFASGIAAFFFSSSPAGLVAGSIIFGFANAGGDVVWSLWVTKFAPPERVTEYMSVHVFFTGVRGVAAPLTAFHLLDYFSVTSLGMVSGAMIIFSSLLLLPETRRGRGLSGREQIGTGMTQLVTVRAAGAEGTRGTDPGQRDPANGSLPGGGAR